MASIKYTDKIPEGLERFFEDGKSKVMFFHAMSWKEVPEDKDFALTVAASLVEEALEWLSKEYHITNKLHAEFKVMHKAGPLAEDDVLGLLIKKEKHG